MKNLHLIKTSNRNCYLYNYDLGRLFLVPPSLYKVLNNESLSDEDENFAYYSRKIEYFKKHHILDRETSCLNYWGISEKTVLNNFINTNQITFEITDKCNIACKYCAYRDLYHDYDKRTNVNLNLDTALSLLYELINYWRSNRDTSSNKIVDIGFYGGEPTLNMDFVRKIVDFINRQQNINRIFTFSMTTNALLLDKHIDYLKEHNFRLLISLDGDSKGNMNRLDKHGKPTFEQVVHNIDLLKTTYPEYFDKYVSFNTVLHDKNPLEDIYHFFHKRYGKVPRLSPLSTTGRNEDKSEVFKEMERNVKKELKGMKKQAEIGTWLGILEPGFLNVANFIYNIIGSTYTNYNTLINEEKQANIIPTGTCLPFSRKIYLTVNDKILPCERVGQSFILGYIKNGVSIDFKKIANDYNVLFSNAMKKCSKCYRLKSCMLCLLAEKGQCNMFMSKEKFNKYWRFYIEKVETTPVLYKKVKDEFVIR